MSRPHFLSPKVPGSNDLPLSNCHIIAYNEIFRTIQLTVPERENQNVGLVLADNEMRAERGSCLITDRIYSCEIS